MNEDITVVMPAYNEAARIGDVITSVCKYVPKENVIVVNDGSVDTTNKVANDLGVNVLHFPQNVGKTHALFGGCVLALQKGAFYTILIDADGQHDPDKLPDFIKSIKENKADVVFGSRNLYEHMPPIRRFGNFMISKTLWLFFGLKLSDVLCGYKIFRMDKFCLIFSKISDRYNIESDIFVNVAKNRLTYSEINIPTNYNNKWSGITKLQGFGILWNVIKRRMFG